MIRVFLEDPRYLPWLEQGLGARRWSHVPSLDGKGPLGAGDVIILLLLHPNDGLLREVRSRAPIAAVIICAPFDRELSRWLGRTGTDAIVWLDEPASELDRAITQVIGIPPRVRLARSIERSGRLTGKALQAVIGPLAEDRSVITKKGLARQIEWSVSTQNRHWKAEVFPLIGITEHTFLQWAAVMHAHEIRLGRRSWTEVASELRVDIKTIRAAAAGTVRVDLPTLARLDVAEVVAKLAEVLAPVLR